MFPAVLPPKYPGSSGRVHAMTFDMDRWQLALDGTRDYVENLISIARELGAPGHAALDAIVLESLTAAHVALRTAADAL